MSSRRGILRAVSQQRATEANVDDSLLVRRAQRGDRAAFDDLVERHIDRVWRIAWRIVRDRSDAEDVVQETFVSAFRALPKFRGDAKFTTWLHRIAVSRALNFKSKASERVKQASQSIDVDPDEFRFEPANEVTPFDELEATELKQRLVLCLERLPEAWRAILTLREVESLSYEAIADTLEIAIGTVRSRLSRARSELRACIEGVRA